MIVGTALVALLALGAALRPDTHPLLGGPALPPPAPPQSTFAIDLRLSLTLPGPPFACAPPQRPPSSYRSLLTCSTTVHPDYNAAGEDWTATVGAALLSDSLIETNVFRLADGRYVSYFSARPNDATKPVRTAVQGVLTSISVR